MPLDRPRFDGTTSWEQYKQVFDAIVRSNGWDNDTTRTGLVGDLSAHYGSPGRLADYRRQFEKTTRTAGEDPSIFATALETLAVKVDP